MTEDDPTGGRVYVSLPSDRFHSSGDALTRGEWERRHSITYERTERKETAA